MLIGVHAMVLRDLLPPELAIRSVAGAEVAIYWGGGG